MSQKKTVRETKAQKVERLIDEAVSLAEELKPKARIQVWSQMAHRGAGRLKIEATEGLE